MVAVTIFFFQLPTSAPVIYCDLLCMSVNVLFRSQRAERRAGPSSFLVYHVGRGINVSAGLHRKRFVVPIFANKLTAPHHVGCHFLLAELVNGMLHLIIFSTDLVLFMVAPVLISGVSSCIRKHFDETTSRTRAETHNRRDQVIGPTLSFYLTLQGKRRM